MSEAPSTSTAVVALDDGVLVFRLDDPEHRYSRVRLDAGLGTSGPRPELAWSDGVWSVRVDLPPLHRIEYGFEVTRTITDPANDLVVDTGFGNRSVLELPAYREPAWLAHRVEEGTTEPVPVALPGVTAQLWSSPGLAESDRATLLVVHDGPDYADRGGLTHYLTTLAAEGTIAPVRALLLTAQPREELYAASDRYATALATRVLPAVTKRWPTGPVVAVGASLGALAALHTQWRFPGTFDGLLLQSGSFFTSETDSQESGFPGWPSVTRFIAVVHADHVAAAALPVTAITCGTQEENAVNNALLAQRLHEVGVDVSHTEVPDLHNFTSWRDALDPALRDLLVATTKA